MDFSKMRYNVERAVREDKLLNDLHPQLMDYEEFSLDDENYMLIIMFLMTDEDSPFLKGYRDNYEMRLLKIYEYLEMDQDELFVKILEGSHNRYNQMVFKWFMIADSLAYETWYSMHVDYHYSNAFLRQPPDYSNNPEKNMDTRTKVRKELATRLKELVDFERDVFTDTQTRKIVKEQVAKSLHFPEQYAQDKEDGKGNIRVI